MPNQESGRASVIYITSCRWVDRYIEGTLENLARRLRSGNDDFAHRFNLVGIVVDDDPVEYAAAWSRGDIWPRRLIVPIRAEHGVISERTLESLTLRIPSKPWRELRRVENECKEAFRMRKAEAKAEYERLILKFMITMRADLVLSDSYLCLFGPDLLASYEGRILNIHPAITEIGDRSRLPGRTPTRDTYTRAAFGYVIIDDKRKVGIPDGRRITVEFNGEQRQAVKVPKNRETGVTVHVVTEDIDAGPVVLCQRYILSEDEVYPEVIRDRNHRIKRDLIPHALLAYIEREDVQEAVCAWRSRMAAFRYEEDGVLGEDHHTLETGC